MVYLQDLVIFDHECSGKKERKRKRQMELSLTCCRSRRYKRKQLSKTFSEHTMSKTTAAPAKESIDPLDLNHLTLPLHISHVKTGNTLCANEHLLHHAGWIDDVGNLQSTEVQTDEDPLAKWFITRYRLV